MQPADEAAEVVADGSEAGVGCTALAMPEVIAAHSMLGFEMADGRLDGGTPAEFPASIVKRTLQESAFTQ